VRHARRVIGNEPPLPPPREWDRRYVEVPRLAEAAHIR
jgi:hypothetical protein